MKTANHLFTFLALAGLFASSVGCSTPSVGDLGDSSSDQTKGDDDDDDDSTTSTKKTTSSSKSTSSTSPTNTADKTAAPADCSTCLAANPKAVEFDKCTQPCQDEKCATDCLTSSGCGADAACKSTLTKCATACGQGGDTTTPPTGTSTTPTDPAGDECVSCLGGANTPAGKYILCSDDCQDQKCDDDCFNKACAGQEDACDSKLQGCSQQCFSDDQAQGQ